MDREKYGKIVLNYVFDYIRNQAKSPKIQIKKNTNLNYLFETNVHEEKIKFLDNISNKLNINENIIIQRHLYGLRLKEFETVADVWVFFMREIEKKEKNKTKKKVQEKNWTNQKIISFESLKKQK